MSARMASVSAGSSTFELSSVESICWLAANARRRSLAYPARPAFRALKKYANNYSRRVESARREFNAIQTLVTSARRSGRRNLRRRRRARLLENLDARAGADSSRPRFDHLLKVFE